MSCGVQARLLGEVFEQKPGFQEALEAPKQPETNHRISRTSEIQNVEEPLTHIGL